MDALLGGMLAARYALQYPQATGHLVLVNPIGLEDWRAEGVPWVIATSVGTPRSPSNVRTALRKARGDGFDWVTPHSLRRTTGTIIAASTGNSLAASRVLGHASTAITEAAYLDWSRLDTDVSGVVQSLAPKVRYLNESAG